MECDFFKCGSPLTCYHSQLMCYCSQLTTLCSCLSFLTYKGWPQVIVYGLQHYFTMPLSMYSNLNSLEPGTNQSTRILTPFLVSEHLKATKHVTLESLNFFQPFFFIFYSICTLNFGTIIFGNEGWLVAKLLEMQARCTLHLVQLSIM